MRLDRRGFLRAAAAVGGVVALRLWPFRPSLLPEAVPVTGAPLRARVVLVATEQHRDGVLRALRLLDPLRLEGRTVVLKPNLNSSHPFPGSTHVDTLRALIEVCRNAGAREITVADRSGMGETARVMQEKGLEPMAREMGVRLVPLDSLPPSAWRSRSGPGWHWARGVLYPTLLDQADAIVQTCCLKTHRFGGQFTLSLKNTVGMVARTGPDGYDYMRELHASPLQRVLIAELNTLYTPALVLLDGIEAFVDGGPESGTLARPRVVLAGTDRVAIDAVGVALLRLHGATGPVASGAIFQQEQIRRAVELGLGVASPAAIDLVTDSAEGQEVIEAVRGELARRG